ncbi:family 16 glycosylhydrolase (plasmid) [Leisingera sp. M527]|uniref:family 16 glycosylhydrolase n=1 Tax=Leisingera sp. M527 TaxID=2867014 RepID=UPI0021A4FB48|nr:family 16 glycosylhydrolase [Leisingera sp. M527]UWQ35118.1 family 16 glycosylhydrolase [Leisingera sp. M527]
MAAITTRGGPSVRLKKSILTSAALGLSCLLMTGAAAGQIEGKTAGVPFRTVFPISGPGANWWRAEYDHPAGWFQTAWRKEAVEFGAAGARMHLAPSDPVDRVDGKEMKTDNGSLLKAGKTSKEFVSGQVQRRNWYGYGRYEVVMQAAAGKGLISAFYLYTGPHFGHSHEEINIEILGKDTARAHFNRFRDGAPLEQPPWVDLGFDAAAAPRLYTIDWSQDAIIWSAGGTELFRLTGAEHVPRPPMKIYFELWAGSEKQAHWSGIAPKDTHASALVQCASYTPPEGGTPSCSELMTTE